MPAASIGGHDPLGGGEIDAERLLAEEVLAGGDGVEVELLVEVVGDGEVEDVDRVVLEQVAAVGRLVGDRGDAVEPAQRLGARVAHADELRHDGVVLQRAPAPDGGRQLAAHEPRADDADADAILRSSRLVPVDGLPQRADHGGGLGVLDDVAPVDDPARALREDDARALEDLLVRHAAAAADEDRDAGRGDDAVVGAEVVGGVGLDDVGAELGGLADEGDDALGVAVDAVAAAWPGPLPAARP